MGWGGWGGGGAFLFYFLFANLYFITFKLKIKQHTTFKIFLYFSQKIKRDISFKFIQTLNEMSSLIFCEINFTKFHLIRPNKKNICVQGNMLEK